MSRFAFSENLFYEPVGFEEFCRLYGKIRPILDPDFTLLAYDKDRRLAAYVLAYPDLCDPTRIVLKTLACNPRFKMSGLGVFLYDQIHNIAAEKGKQAVIHALMHESHLSIKLSLATGSHLFRTYALYEFKNGMQGKSST